MAVAPESEDCEATKNGLHLEEYRGKFPEIPEKDLLRIVQKYASDLVSCQKMLEIESKKCLYGSSPTSGPPTPDTPGPVNLARIRTDAMPPVDLPRSNSTGSAGSSHSSGRSTPVNPIPTPWVIPPRYPVATTAGQIAKPMHFPTTALPPDTVCINGNYYQRLPATGQISPNDQPPGNSPSLPRANKTSPNSSYPIYSTNGFFATSTNRNTPTTAPLQTMAPGMSIPTGYFLPTSQSQPYPIVSQFDPRYHTSPGGVVLSTITTPNMPSNFGHVTSTSSANRQPQEPAALNAEERRSSNQFASGLDRVDARFKSSMVGNTVRQNLEPLYVSTSPAMSSPEILRELSRSSGSPEELQKTLGTLRLGNRQPVANEDYLRACYTHQQKRFLKLQKEYKIEKERLEIVIREISERDGALYDRKYVIEPNPTDEDVAKLSESNEILKRDINEISKNIDRLENGQAFLPPVDPRLHEPQRINSGQRHQDSFVRAQSVPCLHQDPNRVPPPPLSRPLSEHDVNNLEFGRDQVRYQAKPPSDHPMFEDSWNFINPTVIEDPTPPTNIDEETQWSCPRCTFLNHDSLTICEMCGGRRH